MMKTAKIFKNWFALSLVAVTMTAGQGSYDSVRADEPATLPAGKIDGKLPDFEI